MLYESESGDVTMAITGESLITRAKSVFREPRYLKMRDLIRSADVRFTNAEMLFHNYEDAPTHRTGTYMRCDPAFIKDLQWLGFNIVACANNHAHDFGENGVLTNIRYLDEARMFHAGTGRNLAEATAPAYMDTPKGRVALISATTSGQPNMRAGEQRRDVKGRPGTNFIRWSTEWTVDREAFDSMRRVANELGWGQQLATMAASGYGPALDESDSVVYFLDRSGLGGDDPAAKFNLGESFERHTTINQYDMERNLQRISDARRMADWVIFTIHNHEHGKTPEEPSDHIKLLAHAVIDAGADVFAGHGPHQDRGIEIYKGKPIFYSMGDFILENDTVELMPHDNMLNQGLGHEDTPADFFDARSANETRGQAVQPIRWQSAVAMITFKGKQMKELKLHPLDLGYGRPRYQRGRPMMADGDVAKEVLERFQRMSEPFGTKIDIQDGIGNIQLG